MSDAYDLFDLDGFLQEIADAGKKKSKAPKGPAAKGKGAAKPAA